MKFVARLRSSGGLWQTQSMSKDTEQLLLHYLFELRSEVASYLPTTDVALIERAFLLGEQAHRGQTRKSGEPYITHPVAVARILAELKLDAETLSAAILHDAIEDTEVTKDTLLEQFGARVAELVDGVTKLDKVNFASKEQQAAESLRKMFFSMARDPRVILIKLADRLHNMRTLGAQSSSSAKRIAKETLEVYAPIAQRLGMNAIKSELQDLGFRALYPRRHQVIAQTARLQLGKRREMFSDIQAKIQAKLKDEGIHCRMQSRIKTPYSIYSKIVKLKSDKRHRTLSFPGKHRTFEDVTDVYGFRVITPKALHCYTAVGVIHSLYPPKEARFKDFIAVPKANGYQSLHTGVQGPSGVAIEVQIRTDEMDSVAERGMAAHWLYKAGSSSADHASVKSTEWMKDVVENQASINNGMDFLEAVKTDLVFDEVYVFTPQNRVITLPSNATVLDFAYAVHSKIGDHAVTARVDSRTVPLHSRLTSGQTVHIITAKSASPKAQWLEIAVTAKARTAIRHHLKSLDHHEIVSLGHRMLERALASLGSDLNTLPDETMQRALIDLKLKRFEDLLTDIGTGNRTPEVVARQLAIGVSEAAEHAKTEVVRISGNERGAVTFANCCHPIPGDEIFGYLSPGRGLIVHTQICPSFDRAKSKDRLVACAWDDSASGDYAVPLRFEVIDQPGVLARITAAFSDARINITDFHRLTGDGDNAVIVFTVQVRNVQHMEDILRKLRAVDVVQKVVRA